MKHRALLICSLLMLLLILSVLVISKNLPHTAPIVEVSYSSASSSPQHLDDSAKQEALSAYYEVFQDQRSIRTGYHEEYLDLYPQASHTLLLSEYFLDWNVPDPHFFSFALCDLDYDNIPEVILDIAVGSNQYGGRLILRYENGTVYAYSINYNGFYDLKIDGTFLNSDGAFNIRISTISFEQDSYFCVRLSYSQLDPNDNFQVFYDEYGNSISEDEFLAICKNQELKQDVEWHTFSASTIHDVILGSQN